MKIYTKNGDIEYEIISFSAGERHIKIELYYNSIEFPGMVYIEKIIKSSDDLMDILLATNALKNLGYNNITLIIPYIPYSRQDRACNTGEAFSLKVFADIINSQNYHEVVTEDPHSIVCNALINNLVVENSELISVIAEKIDKMANPYIVCPDSGAEKTIRIKLNQALKIRPTIKMKEIIFCGKNRDTKTGKIKSTSVFWHEIQGNEFLIIDDICDGGRTFIEIAKILRKYNSGKIVLIVTHGIFSKGMEVFEGLIDEVLYINKLGVKNG